MVTAEGQTLRSNPTLLAYVDRATGQSVRLADLQPCTGEQVEPGTVLYRNAFDTIRADVRAVYTASGFECDVIIRQALPHPSLFGLNSETTDVEVFSEFFGLQPSAIRERWMPVSETETAADIDLHFGPMVLGPGRAFGLGADLPEIPVRKSWERREERDFLIERTAWRDLEPLLRELPEASVPAPTQRRWQERVRRTAQVELPVRSGELYPWPRSGSGRLRAPEAVLPEVVFHASDTALPGVVLDYVVVNSTANQTFDSLTTYFVSGNVQLTGAVKFMPGTVLKYTNGASLKVMAGATIDWQGAPYRPITLTAYHDNAAGEALPYATGSPSNTYAGKALELDGTGRSTPLVLSNLVVRHAAVGVRGLYFGPSAPLTIRHAQLVECGGAFQFQLGDDSAEAYFVQNALVYSTLSGNITFLNLYHAKVAGTFLTVNGASQLFQTPYNPHYSTVSLANSLIVNTGGTSGVILTNSGAPPGALGSPFAPPAGSGMHYLNLANPSIVAWFEALLAFGNDTFPPDLQAEFALATIRSPPILDSTVNRNLNVTGWNGQDSEVGYLGYHYWAIHALASNPTLNNATLTLTNGAVLGMTGHSGITLGQAAKLIVRGRPDALSRFCWASAVQELPTGTTNPPARHVLKVASGLSIRPVVDLRFLRTDLTADTAIRRWFYYEVTTNSLGSFLVRDSQLFGARFSFAAHNAPQTLRLDNSLFLRTDATLTSLQGDARTLWFRQNLFQAGTLSLNSPLSSAGWTVRENLFDGVTLSGSLYSGLTTGYNAYSAASAWFGGSNNKVSIVAAYQNGPLGKYYYPASGGGTTLAALRNAGSQTAGAAQLYHHTTQVNQAKDGVDDPSKVDVGFHYVATQGSTSTAPTDQDDDQLPDYWEDWDGSGGAPNGGEFSWTLADSDGDGLRDFDELLYGTNPDSDASDADGVDDLDELNQGTDPLDPVNNYPALLGDWRFNTAGSLTNQQGVAPLAGAFAPLTPSYEGWAPVFGSTVATTNILRYPVSDSTRTNLNLRWGTLHFTYVPDWFFGNPSDQPGQWCRLLECGQWQLSISPDGQFVVFETPGPDGTVTRNFTGRLPHSTTPTSYRTAWDIRLEWCRAYTRLTVNDKEVADEYTGLYGVGVTAVPPPGVVATGFRVGSAASGFAGARGYIDQLLTYNCLWWHGYQQPVGTLKNGHTLFRYIADPVFRRGAELTAQVVTSPNGLELNWNRAWEGDPAANAGNYNVERRGVGQSTWTVIATNVFAGTWRDTGAVPGAYYEYRISRSISTNQWPQSAASYRGAAIDSRGKAILIVDTTLATDLAPEIEAFKLDLVADGWQVVSTNLPRHVNFPANGVPHANYISHRNQIKNFIVGQWQTNQTGTNVVILLGHLTVPYSGNTTLGGHIEHRGAWPADAFYGDMDGTWTDTTNHTALSPTPFFRNAIGDGKFDQNVLPGNGRLEVAVGRIDFDHLPSFIGKAAADNAPNEAQVERTLIKKYLTKNALFRRAQLNSFVESTSTFMQDVQFIELTQSAARLANWVNGGPLQYNALGADLFTLGTPRLWGLHGGSGQFYSVMGAGQIERDVPGLADRLIKPNAAFLILRGSWFPDWNYSFEESLLRACLSPTNTGLAVMWAGRDNTGPWATSRMGTGAPLGDVLRETFASPALLPSYPTTAVPPSCRTTFILGDPTLRIYATAPVTNPTHSVSGSTVTLGWAASPTPGATYHVYRASTALAHSWTRLTATPLATPGFVHTSAPSGTNYYLIRALAVKTTGTGSYTNVSLGIRRTAVVP